jgi:hypothetical protein
MEVEMSKVTAVKKFIKARKDKEQAEDAAIFAIAPSVQIAQKAYWHAERQLKEQYGYDYATTCYDFKIGNNTYDGFDILSSSNDSVIVRCHWVDRDGETFTWDLTIPYDMEQLHEYVKRWKEILQMATVEKITAKDDEKTAKRRAEYEKLKKEFDPA